MDFNETGDYDRNWGLFIMATIPWDVSVPFDCGHLTIGIEGALSDMGDTI